MFIEINSIQYNMSTFSSFASRTEQLIEGDETIYKYYIIYEQTNTSAVIEMFDTAAERDEKYRKLIEVFGINLDEETSEEVPSVEPEEVEE